MHFLLRAEFSKALSSRPVGLTFIVALLAPPLLALATGLAFEPTDAAAQALPRESHGFETAGFGQPLIIALAAFIVGAEFSDGQLSTTFTVMPHRGRLLAAKLVVLASITVFVAVIATSAAVLVKHAVIGADGLAPHEFTSGMAWNLGGVVLNYLMMALIAASATAVTRSATVALVVLVPLVLGITISLVSAIPVLKYLPDLAGIQLLTAYPGVGLLDPVAGAAVMAMWMLLIGFAAVITVKMRDVGAAQGRG